VKIIGKVTETPKKRIEENSLAGKTTDLLEE
jgi:hypothetical protein